MAEHCDELLTVCIKDGRIVTHYNGADNGGALIDMMFDDHAVGAMFNAFGRRNFVCITVTWGEGADGELPDDDDDDAEECDSEA